MRIQRQPFFHEFQIMRKVNPVCYYAAETQQQIKDAHDFHGTEAYFKLIEHGGGSFTVDNK